MYYTVETENKTMLRFLMKNNSFEVKKAVVQYVRSQTGERF